MLFHNLTEAKEFIEAHEIRMIDFKMTDIDGLPTSLDEAPGERRNL